MFVWVYTHSTQQYALAYILNLRLYITRYFSYPPQLKEHILKHKGNRNRKKKTRLFLPTHDMKCFSSRPSLSRWERKFCAKKASKHTDTCSSLTRAHSPSPRISTSWCRFLFMSYVLESDESIETCPCIPDACTRLPCIRSMVCIWPLDLTIVASRAWPMSVWTLAVAITFRERIKSMKALLHTDPLFWIRRNESAHAFSNSLSDGFVPVSFLCVCVCVCAYVCVHCVLTGPFRVYVCMHACMHACVYVCMYVCMYVRVCVLCTHRMCLCPLLLVYVCACASVCEYAWPCAWCVCTYIHIHTWKYAYICKQNKFLNTPHTHTHTRPSHTYPTTVAPTVTSPPDFRKSICCCRCLNRF